MKNKSLLILSTLFILPLAGCSGLNIKTIDEKVKTAINSLRDKSHKVEVESSVEVLKPNDDFAVDIRNEYHNFYGYYYNDGEKAYSRQTNYSFTDLDKETGEEIHGRRRSYNNVEEKYFKNNEDGTMYIEQLSIDNKYSRLTMANYNEETGLYTPVIYDSEFKNPFEYISYRDVKVNKDGTLTLLNEKADFLGECYNVVGLNFITDNKIKLNDKGEIDSISFIINDERGETYIRKNELSVKYHRGDDIKLTHLTPCTNNNPELQAALDVLDGKKNFTYIKHMKAEYEHHVSGEKIVVDDRVKGYFTEDEVYFHHELSDNDQTPYVRGDNYDYKAIKNDDGTFTGYEYVYSYAVGGYDWNAVALSSSALYVLNDFSEIGPQLMNLDAVIFKKIDDKTYQIEDYFLPSIGVYFDNGFLGVNSGAFDGNTKKLVIKLDDNGQIEVIESMFKYEMVEYYVNFYIQDIDKTVIPSWSYGPTIVDTTI